MAVKQNIIADENNAPPLSAGERQQLLAEIRKLKSQLAQMARLADADPLVPVKNRRAFLREIERAQTIAKRYKIPSCIVFLDLNDFKNINDKFGHKAGDELLVKIGQALVENVRDSDIIARLGGDEFGVLLFKTEQKTAGIKAKELAGIIGEVKIDIGGNIARVSAAWGSAPCDSDTNLEDIIAAADRAMYKNKTG